MRVLFSETRDSDLSNGLSFVESYTPWKKVIGAPRLGLVVDFAFFFSFARALKVFRNSDGRPTEFLGNSCQLMTAICFFRLVGVSPLSNRFVGAGCVGRESNLLRRVARVTVISRCSTSPPGGNQVDGLPPASSWPNPRRWTNP